MATTPQFSIPPGLSSLLEEFVVKCIQENPEDIVEFAADYFNMLKRFKEKKAASKQAAQSKKESEDKDDLAPAEQPIIKGRSRRAAVSAEPYNPNENADFKAKFHPKSEEQRNHLKKKLLELWLFEKFHREDLDVILDSMFEKKVSPEEIIIKVGDEGDNFYVINTGEYDVFALDTNTGASIKVHTFNGTGMFGELALMHNSLRNATIVAKTEGTLWALDRSTFVQVVVGGAQRRRERNIELLKSVSILKELKPDELDKVSDALYPKEFKDGEAVIREGNESAYCMYFIEKGKVRVTVKDGEVEKTVEFDKNYFGELALVMNQPRSASVYAVGECKFASLKKDDFERLMGPCKEIMKRNAKEYEEQKKKLGIGM
ncbi:predicted protein [Nematostella vectensis]|uniref:cAMP-dependent protein kinase regulatory subunit n=1 Tax=Nematostella vectensis TaxID=45351 RepID=A7S513_NEMVE|nr:predicted protein [Nematostella vectensis]|eukprot:XP_001633226.1 predicted protein [Nematostella vectensis]